MGQHQFQLSRLFQNFQDLFGPERSPRGHHRRLRLFLPRLRGNIALSPDPTFPSWYRIIPIEVLFSSIYLPLDMGLPLASRPSCTS